MIICTSESSKLRICHYKRSGQLKGREVKSRFKSNRLEHGNSQDTSSKTEDGATDRRGGASVGLDRWHGGGTVGSAGWGLDCEVLAPCLSCGEKEYSL